MNIILSNATQTPIYDQIFTQIKAAIVSGDLTPGQPLPSIRALAKDLRVSVITTKRAYDELEKSGFLYTVPGRGCYVSETNTEAVKEAYLTQIEDHLTQALTLSAACGLTVDQLTELLHLLSDES